MRLSVIVSTYNQPKWLELVLWGLSIQSDADFELLIADDGSDGRTADVIEQIADLTTLRPRHVWHEDRGFRKCAILNRALRQASGESLIFLDGDCIPRTDFVAQHRTLAEPRRFLSGGAVRLSASVSHAIGRDDVLGGRAHDLRWLRAQQLPLSRDVLKLISGPRLGRVLDAITPTRPTFNGGNASAWRADLLKTGGFDERMGHGGLDRELGERLENAGIRGRQVRHRCVCVHLDHGRAYANAAHRQVNKRIRRQTRQSQATTTAHGIPRAA
jgi:glycosyltransferase involved in cell wall biosynthesis